MVTVTAGIWLFFSQKEEIDNLNRQLREQNENYAAALRENASAIQEIERLRRALQDNSNSRRDSIRRQNEERELQRFSEPHNLNLAVNRNGRTLYFPSMNAYRSEAGDRKLGVVIINDGVRFILALDDLGDGEYMDWTQAMSRFGNQLPTRSQAEAWASNAGVLANVIASYGGSLSSQREYWTKTEYDSTRSYTLNPRRSTEVRDKTYRLRVRAVYPLP